MDEELIETLKLIIDRYEDRTKGSVFIPMCDFPWYNERNGQLSRLQDMGLIIKPRYFDNGADKLNDHYFLLNRNIIFPLVLSNGNHVE